MKAHKKSRGITPFILNLGSRSGKRPASRRFLFLSYESSPGKHLIGGSVEPMASLITWQVNLTTLTSCRTFSSWNASYKSFWALRAEGGVIDWQQPKLNPSGFNMNRFARICLVALEIRRTGENRPDFSTERVSLRHWERMALRRGSECCCSSTQITVKVAGQMPLPRREYSKEREHLK